VTRAKLRAASRRLRARGLVPAPILCADTAVAIGARILGKPLDAADAARMLALLSGRAIASSAPWRSLRAAAAGSR
jgi:septum formation protein